MKTVLVTGATAGFGKGLVEKFLDEGFRVIASGRNLRSRHEIFAKVRSQHSDRLVELNLDVTVPEDRMQIRQYFENRQLDILVNNAGFAVFGPAETCSEEKIRSQLEVNFFGLVFLTQQLLPALRRSKGHIINFSSVFGVMGFPMSSFYCASKYAVEGFSESLAYELHPHQVRVTLIEPGGYRTNFNQAAQWGSQSDSKTPYDIQLQNFKNLRERLASRPNPPNPEDVIAGVVRIAKTSNPKIHYMFGRDAFFTRVLKRSLTRSGYHRFMKRALTRLLNREMH